MEEIESNVKRGRGRPKKIVVEQPIKDDLLVGEEIPKEEIKVEEKPKEVEEKPKEKINIDVQQENNFYTMKYKFKFLEVVWIPDYRPDCSNNFGVILNSYSYYPTQKKISEISLSNIIRYRFYGSKTNLVAENYVFKTLEECQKACNKLNER